MAKLEKIAALMNITLPPKNNLIKEKSTGKKRRPWLEDEQEVRMLPPLPPVLSDHNSDENQQTGISDTKELQNRVQTGYRTEYKLGTEPSTNWVQTGYKLGTNWVQTGYKLGTARVQTGYKTGYKPGTNRVQTEYNSNTTICFSSVSGIQRNLIMAIYNECKNNRSTVTHPVSIEYLSSIVKSSKNTVKITLKRLEKKNFIMRDSYKAGRGGWTKYRLSNVIYQELLQHESLKLGTEPATNWVQTGYKPGTEPGTEPGTAPSSSSSYIKTTTTAEEKTRQDETQLLEMINIEPLAEIGFSGNHLMQLIKTRLHSFEVLQDSVYAFAYDLKKKAINPRKPLHLFMSVMKNGLYAPASPDYENPQVRAMRIYLEKRQVIEEQKARLEKELMKEHFLSWEESLSEDNKNMLVSEEARNSPLRLIKSIELKSYHQEKIWPVEREKFYQDKGFSIFR